MYVEIPKRTRAFRQTPLGYSMPDEVVYTLWGPPPSPDFLYTAFVGAMSLGTLFATRRITVENPFKTLVD